MIEVIIVLCTSLVLYYIAKFTSICMSSALNWLSDFSAILVLALSSLMSCFKLCSIIAFSFDSCIIIYMHIPNWSTFASIVKTIKINSSTSSDKITTGLQTACLYNLRFLILEISSWAYNSWQRDSYVPGYVCNVHGCIFLGV